MTHAVGGQYKYKGHTISFPQNIEHVYQSLPHPIKDLPIIIVRKKDQCGTNYDFTFNRDRVYRALRYKIENDKFYSDVNVDTHALDDIEKNIDCNIFHQIKTVHVDVDSDSEQIICLQTEMDEANETNINHSTSMETRSLNLEKEMELIHAWINNPNIDP